MRSNIGITLAAAAVLVSNGAALRHAASNRAGIDSDIVLTERELPMSVQENDNTGIWLRFNWPPPLDFSVNGWLDRAKLRELGFDVIADPRQANAVGRYYLTPSRAAYVALEYDGPAWQKYLSSYEASLKNMNSPQIADQLARVRDGGSRLIPIDAATDPAGLRARHPNASQVLIVPAAVRITYPGVGAGQRLTGYLQPVLTQIHVPLPLSRQFDSLTPVPAYSSAFRPRYEVRLRFGMHHEPWVAAVTPLR